VTALERTRAVLDALQLAETEPEPLPDGLSSHAWRIRSPVGDLVLRLPVYLEDAACTYPIEHAVLARLTALGARVPAPFQGSWQIPGWSLGPFSLTSFVAGVPLRAESHDWASTPIGAFLALLHSIPVTGFGPLDTESGRLIGRSTTADGGLLAAFEGFGPWPLDATPLPAHPAGLKRPDLLAAIQARAGLVARAARAGPAVIVHSDLHEENILEDDRRLGFIDFGQCFVGAAGWDFAAIAYFSGWRLADASLAAYRAEPSTSRLDAAPIAALALSFGLYRWQLDRHRGVDGDEYNSGFLDETLNRLRS
jgi:aminoglycoside phosphotransferase (APT) family kinase protein